MKKAFYAGLLFGGILGIAIAASMDLLMGKSFGGGWSQAVAHDLNRLLNTNFSNDSVIIILGVIVVIGIIGVFGALVGGISFILVAWFFRMLTKNPSRADEG